MRKYLIICFTSLSIVLLDSCAKNPVTGKRDLMFISESQEIAMGKQADPEIVNAFGLYDNPALQKFIKDKGQQMANISHRSKLQYEFRVLDSPVINAFAVPGGYVYFTRGILAHFNDEAQFAGVLGHEIGHITARHTAKQQSKAVLAQGALIVGMIVSPEFGQFAEAASQGVGLLFLKFGRDAERESDKLGVEYSSKIGYDASHMADFFQTLHRQQAGSGAGEIPEFLSTHPSPEDRFVTVNKLAGDWKKKLNLTNPKTNRNAYLKMIDGIVFGEDPKQGFVENSIFYHPVLKFQFPVPNAWAHQNSPQQFQMVPKDGKAMMMLTLAPGENLTAAAQQVMQRYQLEVVESKNVTVNGITGLAIVADQKPQQGQQQQQQQQVVRTLTYLLQYGGNIYSLMGVTSQQNFNTYFPVFTASMEAFRPLTDTEKLNRQPERVRVKTLQQGTTLAQALRNYKIPDNRLEEMAILNGMALTDRIEAGTMIKVVEK